MKKTVTKNLMLPTEITKIINDLSVRQITDLAEKGVITPAEETRGQGVARFYDRLNVLSLAVAGALRGILSPRDEKQVVIKFREFIEKEEKGEIEPFDLLIIRPSDNSKMVFTIKSSYEGLNPRTDFVVKGEPPFCKGYFSIVVDVKALRKKFEKSIVNHKGKR